MRVSIVKFVQPKNKQTLLATYLHTTQHLHNTQLITHARLTLYLMSVLGGHNGSKQSRAKRRQRQKNREEFHIDHLHVFSKKSLSFLIKKVKLKTKILKSIEEPSGKFSIFGKFAKWKKLKLKL